MKKFQVWTKYPLNDAEVSAQFDTKAEAEAHCASLPPEARAWIQTKRMTDWLNETFPEDSSF